MIGRLRDVCWYAFLGALWLRTCVPSHLFEPNADAFADLALGTCAVAAIACALLEGSRVPRASRGALALLALALVVAAAGTRDPERRLHALADGAGGLLAFCCAAMHRKRAGELLLTAALAGAFAGLLSFHQSTGQLDLYLAEQRFIQVDRGSLVPARNTSGAVTAERVEALLVTREPFGALQPYYPNALGGFLLLVLPVHAAWTLALRRSGGRPSALAIHGLLLALEAWGLVACGARGVWIAGLLAAALLAGERLLRLTPTAAARVLALLLAGASIAAPLVPPSTDEALHFRAGYWRGAGRSVAEHPWAGHGAGQYPEAYTAHQEAWATFARHAHQDCLQMAVEGGLLLPIAFLLLVCGAVGTTIDRSPLCLGAGSGPGLLLATLLAFAVAWLLPGAIPHTEHASVEILFAAAAATALAGTVALTCPRAATIELPPGALVAARWGIVAVLLLSLGDHPLQVPGIALLFMALAGALGAEPQDGSGGRPTAASHAAAAMLLTTWMAWAWGWALPEAMIPYEAPEDAPATPETWRRVRREAAGRTALREAWVQTMTRAAHASADGALLAECEEEADALLARQPGRGHLWTLKIFLSRRDPARAPVTYDAAGRLVVCFPNTPGPHALRSEILEEIASDPARVDALAKAWELPPHAAVSEVLQESAESARKALDLDTRVPGGERHRRLLEGKREALDEIASRLATGR